MCVFSVQPREPGWNSLGYDICNRRGLDDAFFSLYLPAGTLTLGLMTRSSSKTHDVKLWSTGESPSVPCYAVAV